MKWILNLIRWFFEYRAYKKKVREAQKRRKTIWHMTPEEYDQWEEEEKSRLREYYDGLL